MGGGEEAGEREGETEAGWRRRTRLEVGAVGVRRWEVRWEIRGNGGGISGKLLRGKREDLRVFCLQLCHSQHLDSFFLY